MIFSSVFLINSVSVLSAFITFGQYFCSFVSIVGFLIIASIELTFGKLLNSNILFSIASGVSSKAVEFSLLDKFKLSLLIDI